MRIGLQVVVLAILLLLGGAAWYALILLGGEGDGDQRPSMAAAVQIAAVERQEILRTVESVGSTRALESVNVTPEVSGRVTTIHFQEGDRVSENEVLVSLDDSSYRARLAEALATYDDARAQFTRAERLRQTNNISQSELDQREAAMKVADAQVQVARAELRDRQIRAPFDGITGLREVSRGAYVNTDTVITTLDDLQQLRLDFSVPERFLPGLRAGMSVQVRSDGFDETFDGEVKRLDSRVNPVTRTLRIQAELDNEDGRLRPGMFMNVDLVLDRDPDALVVPEEALLLEGDRKYVYVWLPADEEDETDRVRQQAVSTGLRRGGTVQVTEGLEGDEYVVRSGLQRLRDGAEVRVLNPPDGDDDDAVAAASPAAGG
ncbi:membrane fusion protein (multidrug efflux system) [Alkalispirillum mobile]|uniref:Membrane fusion protein (Multidrug efflux system) n=1 Tax=Alkalispirillum mobile TaxID=85925 RepID=A0A498C2E3_9GAMM|nr:efflux RND transporter periplasmic adaptor subunit [Alkalispirillum mobile]RLK50154.1 membrane fusion protein (multidrug efflux system) [Alkalispirillum mobile]